MVVIEAGIKIIIEVSDNAAGNRNAHSEDIDEDVQLILHHVAKGDEELVLKHG